jgi:hypothetical protein
VRVEPKIAASVIASEAKQSRAASVQQMDCFVAYAPRNDGGNNKDPLGCHQKEGPREAGL